MAQKKAKTDSPVIVKQKEKPEGAYRQCPKCDAWVRGMRTKTCKKEFGGCGAVMPEGEDSGKGAGGKSENYGKPSIPFADFLVMLGKVRAFSKKYGGCEKAQVLVREVRELVAAVGGDANIRKAFETLKELENPRETEEN